MRIATALPAITTVAITSPRPLASLVTLGAGRPAILKQDDYLLLFDSFINKIMGKFRDCNPPSLCFILCLSGCFKNEPASKLSQIERPQPSQARNLYLTNVVISCWVWASVWGMLSGEE